MANIESPLSHMELVNGRSVTADSVGMMKDLLGGTKTVDSPFRGVRIDTGASTSSIMSIAQYSEYCNNFGLFRDIKNLDGRLVKGIGG